MPYECGVDPAGEAAGGRFRVQFFILAILLVVFDVEAMFLFPWAVVLKEIGIVGYLEMFVFMVLLLVGFAYAWLKGRSNGRNRKRDPGQCPLHLGRKRHKLEPKLGPVARNLRHRLLRHRDDLGRVRAL